MARIHQRIFEATHTAALIGFDCLKQVKKVKIN